MENSKGIRHVKWSIRKHLKCGTRIWEIIQPTVSEPRPGPNSQYKSSALYCKQRPMTPAFSQHTRQTRGAREFTPPPPHQAGPTLLPSSAAKDTCSHMWLEKQKTKTLQPFIQHIGQLGNIFSATQRMIYDWLLMFQVLAAFLSRFPSPLPTFPGTTSQINYFTGFLSFGRIPE